MTESEKLLAELRALMRCPVEWRLIEEDDCPSSIVQLDWYHCLAQFVVDEHELPFDPYVFEVMWEGSEEKEIRGTLISLMERRPLAEELYMTKRAGRLNGLRFKTASEYPKHYNGKISSAEAVRRSNNSDSLFWEDYSSACLESAFWLWFGIYFDTVTDYEEYREFVDPDSDEYKSPQAQKWREFIGEHHLRICMNAVHEVGACNGELTSYLCYDIHIGSKTVHCYPVSEAEAKKIMRDDEVVGIDVLNC